LFVSRPATDPLTFAAAKLLIAVCKNILFQLFQEQKKKGIIFVQNDRDLADSQQKRGTAKSYCQPLHFISYVRVFAYIYTATK